MSTQADDPMKPEETAPRQAADSTADNPETAATVPAARLRIPESARRIAIRAGAILIGLVLVLALGVTIASHRFAFSRNGALLQRGVAGDGGAEDIAALRRDTQALTNRLDAADTRITTLEKQTQQTQPLGATALGDLNTRLGAVDSQLSALQSQMARAADKESEAVLAARIAKLEADNSGSALHRAAGILALATLAHATQEGMPFAAQLDALEAATPGDPAIAAMRPLAAEGVPTFPTLAARFPDAARHALDAQRRDGARGGVLARMWASLRSLVSIRRVGDTQGDTGEDRLARAQADMDRNDLAGAVAETRALTGAATVAIAPWRDGAEARLVLDRAVTELNARVVRELAVPAGAPPRRASAAPDPDPALTPAPAPNPAPVPAPAPPSSRAANAPALRALSRGPDAGDAPAAQAPPASDSAPTQ